MEKFDVAVIGAGPGGYVAAIRAAQLGFSVACVEKNKTLGGTCLNVGCIPSKSLLYSSEVYSHLLKEGSELGINSKDLTIDFPQMMHRKNKIVEGLVNGVAGAFKKNLITRLEGHATFLSPERLEVKGATETKVIEAKYFILATGSEPVQLPFLKFGGRVISSTEALSLQSIPRTMLVIGAGVIGVELASVYNRLGSEVTMIEMLPKICPQNDEAVSKMLLQILKKQGLKFLLGAKVKSGKVEEASVALKVEVDHAEVDLSADVCLVAVGRRPYSQSLGLDTIGIQPDSRGQVAVDANFRTACPNVFAIGDLIDGPMLAHKASEEGIAVAEIIAGLKPHVNYLTIPNVIYTSPEVAAVGLTEEEAKGLGIETVIGICSFKANPRARCMGQTEGMVKILGDKKTGRLLGMHIIGPSASEMIGEGVIALEKKATVEELARASHAHPTLAEAIMEASQSALGRSIHL